MPNTHDHTNTRSLVSMLFLSALFGCLVAFTLSTALRPSPAEADSAAIDQAIRASRQRM